MNGRFFDKRKIFVDFYDEFTNYNVQETEEQRQQRQREFDLWIGNIANENVQTSDSSNSSEKSFRFSSLENDLKKNKSDLDETHQKNDGENEDTLDQLKNILDNDYSNSESSDDSESSSDD
jgi:hypothetical protein